MDEELLEEMEGAAAQQIIFRVGSSLLAVSSEYVQAISSLPELTQEATDRPYVMGMCHISNQIVSVIDTGSLLHLAAARQITSDRSAREMLLVLNGEVQIGLFADAVVSIKETEDCICPPKSAMMDDIVKSNYIVDGMNGVIMELDVPKVFAAVG